MGKKKQPINQFAIDFRLQNRTLLHLGQIAAQRQGEELFQALLNEEWLLEPAGEVADVSSGQDIIRQLGRRLSYPETVKVAQLHRLETEFVGFSALYQDKGWVFINARADEHERYYYTSLLVASLGLYMAYPKVDVLYQRAEKLIFDALLPESEVQSFFHRGITKISPSLAMDIADFFRVPFFVVLKRALTLEVISDEQYRNFMTVKPEHPVKARPLFVSKSGHIEGDFDDEQWIGGGF
ncbi:hypothetical protein [Runella zeae]|jgi:hypothetical protein|uniref:hypothetical protein n=1 Tax=Runella zeae TaxID=94255 RepID=UPI0004204209|nr:hypothetical protein [Runella zeae]